jgi:DNA primase
MIDYLALLDKYNIGIDRHAGEDEVFIDTCPYHDENTPSLAFNIKTGVFYCHGCKEAGTFEKLLADYTGMSRVDAKQELLSLETADNLIDELNDSIEELDREEVKKELKYLSIKSFHKIYKPLELCPKSWQYVVDRGFKPNTIREFDFRYGGKSGRWAERVIIPIYNEGGKLLSFTGRTLIKGKNPKYKNVKGRSNLRALYGLNNLLVKYNIGKSKFPYLMVEEGTLDASYLQQFGILAVSTTGTNELKPHQVYLLKRYADMVVLNYDGDRAGDKAFEINRGLLTKYLPVVELKIPGGKDPNDLRPSEVQKVYKEYLNASTI